MSDKMIGIEDLKTRREQLLAEGKIILDKIESLKNEVVAWTNNFHANHGAISLLDQQMATLDVKDASV
jgi:hypothetical protein